MRPDALVCLLHRSSNILVQSSIPLDETKSLRHFFVTKVVSPFRQRWHSLFFDESFLDQDTIQVRCEVG